MRQHLPLLLLISAYLLVASLFARHTPPWQAPDEPAHYNYIGQLADGKLPVIEANDYDEDYRRQIVASKFVAPLSIEPLTYEDWQPPLYYLLLTPVFLAFNGALLPLRLATVLIGAGILLLTYGVALQVWPERRWLALLATAFVAFLPQHVAMLSAINNDSLSELFIAALLLLVLLNLQSQGEDTRAINRVQWLAPGILLGLGFLTKATVYIMAPALAAILIWFYRTCRAKLIRSITFVFGPALLLGLPWWLRNIVVYPGFDPLGTGAHEAIVEGQVRTSEWLAHYGLWGTVQRFLRTTFQSFWGQFGWMGVLMDTRIYLLLLLFSILVGLGVLWALRKHLTRKRELEEESVRNGESNRVAYVLLATVFVLSSLLYLGYNFTFVQHQGRYLFPALIPISVGLALGINSWTARWTERYPWLRALLVLTFTLGLIALDLIALFRFIVPQLSVS